MSDEQAKRHSFHMLVGSQQHFSFFVVDNLCQKCEPEQPQNTQLERLLDPELTAIPISQDMKTPTMANRQLLNIQLDYGADDPIWIDEAWLDTVVTVGLTCFVLCLMNLSKVRISVAQPTSLFFDKTSRIQHLKGCYFQNGYAVRDSWNDLSHCWLLGRQRLYF